MCLSLRSSGAIPESLGGLTNLVDLGLHSNELSGVVPLISFDMNVTVCERVDQSMCLLAAGRLSLSLLIGGTDAKM